MITKRELERQRLMKLCMDTQEMGQDLCDSIKNAHWKNVKRFKMPTDHMKRSVSTWEAFWKIKEK